MFKALCATRRILGACLFIAGCFLLTPVRAAESNFATSASFSQPYIITIKGVYLKDDIGQWVKIIEPDRRVDLAKEEPVVTFFNNGGRVPAGDYKNFRIDFYKEDYSRVRRISSKMDFEKSVRVKKGSFIYASFELALDKTIELRGAAVTVDDDAREFTADALTMEV